MTQIFQTMVGSPETPDLSKVDTILHEGGVWIVPKWLAAPTQGWQKPAYIIRIDTLVFQHTPGGAFGDYLLQTPIPKAVLDGSPSPKQAGEFEIVHAPDITVKVGAA